MTSSKRAGRTGVGLAVVLIAALLLFQGCTPGDNVLSDRPREGRGEAEIVGDIVLYDSEGDIVNSFPVCSRIDWSGTLLSVATCEGRRILWNGIWFYEER